MTIEERKEILSELDINYFWGNLIALIDKFNEWEVYFMNNFDPSVKPSNDVVVPVVMAFQNEIERLNKLMEI